MSIEDIQKINQMAKNLLDNGMVSSREEAVREAQRILNKEIVNKQETKEDGSISAGNNMDHFKNIITRIKEYTLQQLNNFKKDIENLTAEIHKLKNEISILKVTRSAEKQDDEPKEPAQQRLKTKKTETNQRTGKISPEEVAVDKIFYYGNKR